MTLSGKFGIITPKETPLAVFQRIQCKICAIGKKNTVRHPSEGLFKKQKGIPKPYEYLSVVLCGPYEIEGLGGEKHMLCIHDIGTKAVTAIPLKRK